MSHKSLTSRSGIRRYIDAAAFRTFERAARPARAARTSQFEAVPIPEGAVVFLGASMIEQGLWDAWFPTVRAVNRGIGGETTADIRRRLASAIASPAAVFFLAGTNDLTRGVPQAQTVEETRRIVDTIIQCAPGCTVYLQSVTPRALRYRDELVRLNGELRSLAEARAPRVEFVDLWPVLADREGALIAEFTHDSVHLNGSGYAAWTSAIRPLVEVFATAVPSPVTEINRPPATLKAGAKQRSTNAPA